MDSEYGSLVTVAFATQLALPIRFLTPFLVVFAQKQALRHQPLPTIKQ